MARDPGSRWSPLPEAGAPDGHTKTQLIVHSTGTMASAAANFRYFSGSAVGVESTFIIGLAPSDPTLQIMDSTDRADANGTANNRAISIEVVGDGVGPYTQWQIDELIRIGKWAAATHPIAKRVIPSEAASGFGWHVMFGAPGPWTSVRGKVPLALDVLIPTGRGPVLLADVEIGDTVYDENGKPCTVTGTHDVTPEKAYRLTFNDGSEVTTSDTHLWAYVGMDQLRSRVRGRRVVNGRRTSTTSLKRAPADWASWNEAASTEQIAARPSKSIGIPVALAANTPDRDDLPLDPYLLGAWLGDGGARDGTMCASPADFEEVRAAFEAGGFTTGQIDRRERVVVWRPLGLEAVLRRMNVLGNKHVPSTYLSAGTEQRAALLAGLLDTDGHIAAGNRVEFVNKIEALSDAVLYLAASLGQRPRKAAKKATLGGIEYGPYHRIMWRATRQCFRMERKAARLVVDDGTIETNVRMLTAATEVPPVPMRCLTVDSPNSVFCATERFIPTHNCPGNARIEQLKRVVFPAIFAPAPAPAAKPVPTPAPEVDMLPDERKMLERIHFELTNRFPSRVPGSKAAETAVGYILNTDAATWQSLQLDRAQTAAITALSTLVAQQNGLTIDEVRRVVSEEIAKGVDVAVTVAPGTA